MKNPDFIYVKKKYFNSIQFLDFRFDPYEEK